MALSTAWAVWIVSKKRFGQPTATSSSTLKRRNTIIWLQQIGRGLRISGDKKRLVVIDYIGNHRVFLLKLQGMAVVVGRDAETSGRQREILDAIRNKKISLPVGCEITYETSAIDILQHLLRPTRTEEVIAAFYRDFEERNGIRPTATETHHAGLNPRSNSERSWLGFVDRMGGLDSIEKALWSANRDFFVNLEKTEMSRSYKIVLLLAMFDGDTLNPSLSIEEITRRVATLLGRMHGLAKDFSIDLSDAKLLRRLLVDNPIEAFVNARGMGGVPYFKFDGKIFAFAFEISEPSSFGVVLREILDWRLAQYLSRGQSAANVICRVSRSGSGDPILFLPANDGKGLPEGLLEIEVNDRPMEAVVAKIAINVVRDEGSSTNELPTILRTWFGEDVGLPGRSDRVRFRSQADKIVMEPFGSSAKSSSELKLWERYFREAIAPAFGLTFSTGAWNAGFVVSRPHIFLLVTLTKDDMNPEHQYSDHFLSSQEFNWQSQNQTTQESTRGRMIHDHATMGIHVHLFVRPTKKTGPKPTPFVYCGEVDFVSWEGNSPITVRWRLKEKIPPSLCPYLQVPG